MPSFFKGLRISRIYGRQGSVTFESNGLFIIVKGKVKRLFFPGWSDISGYQSMFRDFFKALRNNSQPRFTLDSAKKDLEYLEAIQAAESK